VNIRYTLKKNSDFRRLYAKGKSAVTPYMIVYCRRNRGTDNRVGYTVSAKLGHAVVRNRARRRLREVYRLHADSLKPGLDFVIVARSRCIKADWSTLNEAFEKACDELGVRRETAQ